MRETVIRCMFCEDVRVIQTHSWAGSEDNCPRCGHNERSVETVRQSSQAELIENQTFKLGNYIDLHPDSPWAKSLLMALTSSTQAPWLIEQDAIDASGGSRQVMLHLRRCGYMAWIHQRGIAVRLQRLNMTHLPNVGREELLSRWSSVFKYGQPRLNAWLESLDVQKSERWPRLLLTTYKHLHISELIVVARKLIQIDPTLDIVPEFNLDPFMVDEHLSPLNGPQHVQQLLIQLVAPKRPSPWIGEIGRLLRSLRHTLRKRWYTPVVDEGYLPDQLTAFDHALQQRGLNSWRTPSQRDATKLILDGQDDGIVILPTGHGKTLCFDLAAECMDEGDYILVVSPLLALMESQNNTFGERSVWFKGNMEEDARLDAFDELEDVDIVLISPESLGPNFLSMLRDYRLPRRIVIDEAHCVLAWGNGFRPEYLELGRTRQLLENALGASIPMIALTATLTANGIDELTQILSLRKPVIIRESADRPELTFEALAIETNDRRLKLITSFLEQNQHTTGIIRVANATGVSPLSAEALTKHLRERNLDVEAFHAGLSDTQKTALMAQLNERALQALVVTSSFGMGIDLPFLEWVIHAQPPTTLADYLQGAGRAGRGMSPDIEQARCIVIGAESDRKSLSQHLYYHLPRVDTVQGMISHWVDSPAEEPEPGVYVDQKTSVISIDTKRQIKQSMVIRYAARKGSIELLRSTNNDLLRFRIPKHPDVWNTFGKKRERDRTLVDMEWIRVMSLVTGTNRCRRAIILEAFDDEPQPPYLRCCDVCDGPLMTEYL